jgi:hypothetical protein
VCIALTFFLAASVEAAAQDTTPALRLQDQIALGAPAKAKGMLFDPVSGDLLIAHGTEITVVDPAARKIVGHRRICRRAWHCRRCGRRRLCRQRQGGGADRI